MLYILFISNFHNKFHFYVLCRFVHTFSLLCYFPIYDLYPFPTRRSSDLCFVPSNTRHRPASLHTCGGRRPCAVTRSEEHTSELQSPCNIVCRLLFEKKKKVYNVYREIYSIFIFCDVIKFWLIYIYYYSIN